MTEKHTLEEYQKANQKRYKPFNDEKLDILMDLGLSLKFIKYAKILKVDTFISSKNLKTRYVEINIEFKGLLNLDYVASSLYTELCDSKYYYLDRYYPGFVQFTLQYPKKRKPPFSPVYGKNNGYTFKEYLEANAERANPLSLKELALIAKLGLDIDYLLDNDGIFCVRHLPVLDKIVVYTTDPIFFVKKNKYYLARTATAWCYETIFKSPCKDDV